MATFGKTTDGASSSTSNADKVAVSRAVVGETGTVLTGHAQLGSTSAAPTRFAIYPDVGDAPGTTPLAVSDVLTPSINGAVAWRTFTFSGGQQVAVTAGTVVWIGPAWEGGHSVTFGRDANGTGTADQRREGTISAWPTLTSPTWAAAQTGPMAAYVTTQASEVTKTGSDTSTGSETGGVSASVDGSDTATGSDTGGLVQDGSDSATGSETGFVAEDRTGGDTGAASEAGDSAATVDAGDTGTGAESGSSTAAISIDTDTATGSETGYIGLLGEDTATGVDEHQAPTQVTIDTGDTGTGSDGGYVETLFGDLIVSLYGVDPDTGGLFALPDFRGLDASRERNSKGAIRVGYARQKDDGGPAIGFDRLRQAVTTSRDLEIELRTNGTAFGALRGYLKDGRGDDITEDGTWEFSGGFLEILADEAVVYPQDRGALVIDPNSGEPVYENAKREFIVNADSPGIIMATLLEQAQDRGVLLDVVADFTGTHDSNGVEWAGVLSAKFAPGVTYGQILGKMVDLGLAEWAIVWDAEQQQKVLRLWNSEGRGSDLTVGPRPVTLRRGRNLIDAPRQWSVVDAPTTILAAGSEGIYTDATDATALARRGRRVEGYATLGSAADEAAVEAFALAELAIRAPGVSSVEHGIGMLPGEPRPVVAFDIGDWVLSQSGVEPERLRVVQWTLTIDEQRNLAGTVTLNDLVQDMIERLTEQQTAITSGEAVTGASDPGAQVTDRTPPAAPQGVVAASKAYQDPNATDGPGQTYAWVDVAWLPVTTNADGFDNPLVQAAQLILDKIEDEIANPPVPPEDPEDPGSDYKPFDPSTWTWKDCEQLVRDFAALVRALWVEDGSPDTVTWLTGYIAEQSQTPTVAEDVAGYDVRYSVLGIDQVGGIPSSDPFPEDERFYQPATPPGGTAGTNFAFGGVTAGSRLRIEVRAFDRSGNYGAWTDIAHDTQADTTAPPVPSAPAGLKTWFRTLDVPWDGTGSEGEPMPIDFFYARVWIGQGADLTLPAEEDVIGPVQFDPTETGPQWVANLYAAGSWNVPDLPYGPGWFACLQTVDYTGNASARSEVVGPVYAEQLFSEDLRNEIINDPNMIAAQTVGTLHVVDAAIIGAKIALATIEAANIATVNAGSIVTGTMVATVTVTGSLWTSTDANATRLGFGAFGLQMYRTNSPAAGSTLIGEWRTADGSMLVTGTYRSNISGKRIHIDPDGSLRFYPASGTNYSQITNASGEAVWRGPLDGGQRSGRVNVNMLGVGLNFSAEANLLENIRSEFLLLDRQTRMTAPYMNFQVDERWSSPVSGINSGRRIQFSTIDSDGDFITKSGLSYITDPSTNAGGFVGNDAGWKFDLNGDGDGRFMVTNGTMTGFGVGQATAWDGPCSETIKADIQDARKLLNPLQTVKNARARSYRLPGEGPDAPTRLGPIAEEIPEVLRRPMTMPGTGEEIIGMSLNDQIGLLWAAVNQLIDQETRIVSGRAFVPNGTYRDGATLDIPITWDTAAPEVPSDVTAAALASMPTAMGKIRALVVPGSVTTTGCTIRLTFSGIGTVAVNVALPIAVEATGRYIWTPPPPEDA